MADTTPHLNVAPADPQTNYAPISWMAAAAFGIALVFGLLLLILAFFAFREHKPLVEQWLFAFPVFGIVLAFAARRHIQNSERTRTGLPWATRAWWICVVGGLGYAVYLGAMEFTINYDTKQQFNSWADNVKKADPNTPNDPALSAGFYQTLPPNQRIAFSASSTTDMQNRFGPDFTTFRQNKLLILLERNRDRSELASQGLKQWQQTPGKIECSLAGTLKTPEGEFQLVIPMVATVTGGKREWQIAAFDGYVQDGPGTLRTPYGWLVEWLDGTAKIAAEQFLSSAGARTNLNGIPIVIPDGILAQPIAHDVFASRKFDKAVGDKIVFSAIDRSIVAGNLGLFWPTSPAYTRGLQGDFLVQTPMPDGKMVPDSSREELLYCWNNAGFDKITMSGRNIANSTDKNCHLRFFDDRAEISVPIELKVQKSAPQNSAALGRLVLTLDDPELLAELAQARELGLQGEKTAVFPTELQKRFPKWKVTRIESNLKVIRVATPGQGAPGGSGE